MPFGKYPAEQISVVLRPFPADGKGDIHAAFVQQVKYLRQRLGIPADRAFKGYAVPVAALVDGKARYRHGFCGIRMYECNVQPCDYRRKQQVYRKHSPDTFELRF